LDEEEQSYLNYLPKTEKELRQYFLNKLYPFQLKWATSTVVNISFMDQTYNDDPILKYFLQRFPDIYLIMYYPIFNIKNAPVDGEIILISPFYIEIIYILEKQTPSLIIASNERTWTVSLDEKQKQILSPLIALRRTEQIVRSVLKTEEIKFPITKSVISRTNDIVYDEEPYNTNFVGKRYYKDWFQRKRQISSPLKNIQLRVIETLLKYCLSNYVKRPEWVEDKQFFVEQDE